MKSVILIILSGLLFFTSCESSFFDQSNTRDPVLNGSYSNMLTIGEYLYAINKEELVTFNVSDASNPIIINEQELGFNLESLLFHKGNLFIGSSDAMYIYAINKDGIPERVSVTDYFLNDFNVCNSDPIAVKEDYAYVTLSSSIVTFCDRIATLNELQVYNIEDIEAPTLQRQVEMIQPKGLAIDGDLLFVCEANDGIKVFNISIPNDPYLVDSYDNFEAFDVIADKGLLIIVGPEKIYEFSYSESGKLNFLSDLEI